MTTFVRWFAGFDSRTTSDKLPTQLSRWTIIGVLSAVAMLVTLHVWFNVLLIPLELPSPSLFAPPRGGPPPMWMGPGEKPKDGWTVWYLPTLVTAFLASVALARLTRKRERWTVLSMAIAGCTAVIIGATIACWAEHNGYIWYFRPEMTPRLLLGVQGELVVTSLVEGLGVVVNQWPILLIGSAAGGVCALVVGAPLRRQTAAPAHSPHASSRSTIQTT